MFLIDSHCHIHDERFPIDTTEVINSATRNQVHAAVCIGVDGQNSELAVKFAKEQSRQDFELYANVGFHPHEAKFLDSAELEKLRQLAKNQKVIAIGEIGLDYHYMHSSKQQQIAALESQIDLAIQLSLPISFHIREAYDDFWAVFDNFSHHKIRGVAHSFSDSSHNLEKALSRGLMIGVNGISTFVRQAKDLEMFSQIPLERTILETDAPFLAPKNHRGRTSHPGMIKDIAEDLAQKRGLQLEDIASLTTANFKDLYL